MAAVERVDTVLESWTEWFCLDCKLHFNCYWPPACPNCGQGALNEPWLEQRRRSEEAYWEMHKRVAEANRRRREEYKAREAERAAELKVRNEILTKILNAANVPLPEDEKAYGQAHLWTHRPRMVVNFFKRYNSWISRVPSLIAARQAKWEIDQQIIRLRRAGVSYREIGRLVDLSHHRVQSIYGNEVFRSRYYQKYDDDDNPLPLGNYPRAKSPVEKWLEKTDWLDEFRDKVKRQILKRGKRTAELQQWMEI